MSVKGQRLLEWELRLKALFKYKQQQAVHNKEKLIFSK